MQECVQLHAPAALPSIKEPPLPSEGRVWASRRRRNSVTSAGRRKPSRPSRNVVTIVTELSS